MTTIDLVYDGKTFQSVAPVHLPVGARLTAQWKENIAPREGAWDVLRRLAGTVEMPEDWSANHDAYLTDEEGSETHRKKEGHETQTPPLA